MCTAFKTYAGTCSRYAPTYIGRVCNSSESLFAEKIPDKSENARAIVRACGICDPHKTWSGVSTGTWQLVG